MSVPEKSVVMVVDDTPTNIDLLIEILGEDHEVRVALDGTSALEDVASEVPDIILLDIMMPGMDGYEVCRRLKADPHTRKIPVIFVTAKGEVTDEIEGFECGAVDYITKPVSAPVVRARVAAHLALVRQNRILEENVRLREEVDRIGRHDLKTPLNRIISLPRILMEEANFPAAHRETLRSIEEAGYTILGMINRSLDLFKMESGTYRFSAEPVDLRGIVLKICSDLSAAAQEKGCGFDLKVDESPGTDGKFYVSGEPLLCYSLAANLIKNALEASPERTRVQIRLGREGETAVFTVHNSGEVPESVRDRFFEKYSTAGKRGGTGLGTYSAHLMARTMGGTIDMATGPEEGTRVWVSLPAASAPGPPSHGRSARPAEGKPWRERELPALRLLMVDDDADNLAILHRFLDHPSLTIDRATDGRQALEMWGNGRYDLILMDLEMPVMDGRAAVTRIRAEEDPGADPVTVVALSAHGDEMAGDCLDAGFDGLVTKPVSPEALHELILKGGALRRQNSDRGGSKTEIPERDPDLVAVDRDLEDIVPGFLENKRVQILEIIERIGKADGEGVRRSAHKLKGGFNMYGLSVLGAVCADLEEAAKTGEAEEMQRLGQVLSRRFDRLKIVYR